LAKEWNRAHHCNQALSGKNLPAEVSNGNQNIAKPQSIELRDQLCLVLSDFSSLARSSSLELEPLNQMRRLVTDSDYLGTAQAGECRSIAVGSPGRSLFRSSQPEANGESRGPAHRTPANPSTLKQVCPFRT